MKIIFPLIFIAIFFSACQEMTEPEIDEPQHFTFTDSLDHLPLDNFNNYSKVIFRNSFGENKEFSIKISEDVVDKKFEDIPYSTNKLSFQYQTAFNFAISNLTVEASIEYLQDRGFSEVIKCDTHLEATNVEASKLYIVPNENYENTILNEKFIWMEEEFTNVYSNVLIQENATDNVKIFYQPAVGIIGFVDFANNSWILDRFE